MLIQFNRFNKYQYFKYENNVDLILIREPELFRNALDRITHDSITWDPYTAHREVHPLEIISYYRGFIRWGGIMVPYLPDRVLRQFGFV